MQLSPGREAGRFFSSGKCESLSCGGGRSLIKVHATPGSETGVIRSALIHPFPPGANTRRTAARRFLRTPYRALGRARRGRWRRVIFRLRQQYSSAVRYSRAVHHHNESWCELVHHYMDSTPCNPLFAGRNFQMTGIMPMPEGCDCDRLVATKILDREAAIGKGIRSRDEDFPREIAVWWVTPRHRTGRSSGDQATPTVPGGGWGSDKAIRTSGDPAAIPARASRSIGPIRTFRIKVRTRDAASSSRPWLAPVSTSIFTVFAGVALMLRHGKYGVMASQLLSAPVNSGSLSLWARTATWLQSGPAPGAVALPSELLRTGRAFAAVVTQ